MTDWDFALQRVRWIGGSISFLIALLLVAKPEFGRGALGDALLIVCFATGLPAGFANLLVVQPFLRRSR